MRKRTVAPAAASAVRSPYRDRRGASAGEQGRRCRVELKGYALAASSAKASCRRRRGAPGSLSEEALAADMMRRGGRVALVALRSEWRRKRSAGQVRRVAQVLEPRRAAGERVGSIRRGAPSAATPRSAAMASANVRAQGAPARAVAKRSFLRIDQDAGRGGVGRRCARP